MPRTTLKPSSSDQKPGEVLKDFCVPLDDLPPSFFHRYISFYRLDVPHNASLQKVREVVQRHFERELDIDGQAAGEEFVSLGLFAEHPDIDSSILEVAPSRPWLSLFESLERQEIVEKKIRSLSPQKERPKARELQHHSVLDCLKGSSEYDVVG